MATIHLQQTTRATPEQLVAALTDFGPGRSVLFGNSADKYLKVHDQGPSRADVTEGSNGIWERLTYDWSDPDRIVMTTTDSNVWGGRSGHTYTFTRRPDRTTEVDVVVVREGKNLQGRALAIVVGIIGKRFLSKQLESTVKAIETRNPAMPEAAERQMTEPTGRSRLAGPRTGPPFSSGSATAAEPRLVSLNVGMPKDVEWRGRTVHTGIWKVPVTGPRRVRRLNVDGDGQGDLAGHGGEQRAIYVYQLDSYRYWADRLGRNDFVPGQFGENFTVSGLADADVCIGDRYQVGGALLEVTQPRVTCYRLGIRMDEPRMPALLTGEGRPGFYVRVLEEGDVETGVPIVKVADGPERMSVAEVNALLYRSPHPREALRRALRIPALSPGWQVSFQALLEDLGGRGNPGLVASAGPAPAWPGFRAARVVARRQESTTVWTFVLEADEADPDRDRPVGLPGQFVTLRMQAADGPAVLRSYSLSGPALAGRWQVSVKREEAGIGSRLLVDGTRVGDRVDLAAPRGGFLLLAGGRPVVLVSAGIGATPVLAMLAALASSSARRPVWWVHGARNGQEHPFAAETGTLLSTLPDAHRHVRFSRPTADDRLGEDFDAAGRVTADVLEEIGVPHDADYYLCGPPAFLADLRTGLANLGVLPDRIHVELFGAAPGQQPGVVPTAARAPHPPDRPAHTGPLVSFARSAVTARFGSGTGSLLELAEACDVPVRWSCRTGVCHSCETSLLAGAAGYAPDPIDSPGDGRVLICCAYPTTEVVLDL